MGKKKQEYIYIMVSRTNTMLGKVIQMALGVSYNHCSIALDDSLESIYSFGRKEIGNMFVAGFVQESKNSGFFAVHDKSNIALLRLSVSREEKMRIHEIISEFQQSKEPCKYSLLGLLYCYRGIPVERENKFFCSQFVAQVLQLAGVDVFDKPASLIRPHDFLEIPFAEFVYTGTIGSYGIN